MVRGVNYTCFLSQNSRWGVWQNKGWCNRPVKCDLRFDTVPHRRLMTTLDHYGIRCNLHSLIRNFLVNRTQQVVCDGQSSKSIKVASGVPQSTVLSTIVSVFYQWHIRLHYSSCCLFADDCLVHRLINCIDDLTSLNEWSIKWGMRLNPQKCYITNTPDR